MKTQILTLTVITAMGSKGYRAGDTLNGHVIHKIQVAELYFTGDPFDHYVGYSESGEMLFSVNCLCPCDVEYNVKN